MHSTKWSVSRAAHTNTTHCSNSFFTERIEWRSTKENADASLDFSNPTAFGSNTIATNTKQTTSTTQKKTQYPGSKAVNDATRKQANQS